MPSLRMQVIQSLNGLSDDKLQFLLDMIQRFMKAEEISEENISEVGMTRSGTRRIGCLEGQGLIDADYDIDECNDEIAEMFGD